MREIKFKDLETIKDFRREGDQLVWNPFNIDNWMGFTICRIRAVNRLNGVATLKYTEEYVMGGVSTERECLDEELINRMKNALERLLVRE